MAATIMIAGLGSAGNYVLDMASKMPVFGDCSFVVVSRSPAEIIEKRLNITRISAGLFDLYPKITYVRRDLHDIEGMTRLLGEVRPGIIAYTGRYIKGLKYGAFSYPNQMGYGVWTPLSIVLIHKLMRAVELSGCGARVINTSYGDAVSPALAAVGLAPFVSAGNINHLIPRLRRAIARAAGGFDPENADVRLVGSHYLNTYVSREGSARGSAYGLHWTYNGKKSASPSDSELFAGCCDATVSGAERNWMIASDVVRLMELMFLRDGRERIIHAPGPFGLIGGYPLCFKDGEMRLDESHFSRGDMIAINEKSLACDGIGKIDASGIHFTDEARQRMKDVFSMEYPEVLAVSECEAFAERLAGAVGSHRQ